jgi:serine/threonine protein kinase
MLEGQQLQELTGRSFGGYRIDQVIGADRLGARAVGQEATTGRPAALRLLHPYFRNDAGFAARFDTFARMVGQLNHPNIARLLDAGIDGDQPFTILDADGGESLRSWLGRQPGLDDPVRVGAVLAIVAQLSSALTYAHRLGAIHAGLSPDNVTVAADGRAHLRDFGLVLAVGEAAGVLLTRRSTPPQRRWPA